MKVLITGATGFIGTALARRFDRPVVLTRDPKRAAHLKDAEVHAWDPMAGPPPAAALKGVDAVFNLMGEPIAQGRWNPEKLRRIRDSRVTGTRHLVEGLAGAGKPPAVLVSASAIGFYGSRGDEPLDEQSAPGRDALAATCGAWEAEARTAAAAGVRVVVIRNGIVLRKEGGALRQMLLPFRLGLGGRLGDGKQWMSWIHLEDLVGLYVRAAEQAEGPVTLNGVSPAPARNAEFTAELGRAVHRPAILPVPAFAVRLAFGGVADIMLGSQRVMPRAAEQAGFAFRYPTLKSCLAAALA